MEREPRPLSSKIYILPNLFTAFNIFLGWWAIALAFNGNIRKACWMVFAATLLDVVDGAVARMTNTQSRFGAELDSMADIVSFGVAPAVLAFATMTRLPGLDHPNLIFGICGLFAICGALRLARYNVKDTSEERKGFLGLPIPAAAGVLIMSILLIEEHIFDPGRYPRMASIMITALPLTVLVLASLMVSEVPYASLAQKIRIQRSMSFHSLVSIVFIGMLFIFLKFDVRVFLLFSLGMTYVLGGIGIYIYNLLNPARSSASSPESNEQT